MSSENLIRQDFDFSDVGDGAGAQTIKPASDGPVDALYFSDEGGGAFNDNDINDDDTNSSAFYPIAFLKHIVAQQNQENNAEAEAAGTGPPVLEEVHVIYDVGSENITPIDV